MPLRLPSASRKYIFVRSCARYLSVAIIVLSRGDTAKPFSAGAIAGAVGATRLLFLTDVPGVLDKDKVLIPELTVSQARRLIRRQARRDAALKAFRPTRMSPMRPGLPPGWRDRRLHEVDDILRECHGVANDLLNELPDTS